MRRARALLVRCGALFHKRRADRDLEDELESHVAMHVEDAMRRGMSAGEARREAILKLGGIEPTKEACRDRRGLPLLESAVADVRYALRALRRSPGFAAVVIVVLALGTGANTAVFSLVDTVLLRMLPVRAPERLVFVDARPAARSGAIRIPRPISNAGLKRMQESATRVAGLGAFQAEDRLNIAVNGRSELVSGHFVSGSYFGLLGIHADRGRAIGPADDRPEGRVAVLGFGYWQRRFGAAPDAIGKDVRINNVPFTIVGVAPREFHGLSADTDAEVMLPLATAPQVWDGRLSAESPKADGFAGRVFARLKDGVSSAEAGAELEVILRQSQPLGAANNVQIDVTPAGRGLSNVRKHFSNALKVLTAVVALVLLIACANIANLLLARSKAREHEFAIRFSLGAGRRRLMRQLLTEGLVLAAAGALLGLPLAAWVRGAIVYLVSEGEGPAAIPMHWDARIFAFTASVSILSAVLFGLAPALRATRFDSMKQRGASRFELRGALVAGQVAVSLALLAGAALFLGTLRNLDSIDTGFARRDMALVTIDAKLAGYDEARAGGVFRQALEHVAAIPGVRAASLMRHRVLGGVMQMRTISVPGYTPRHGENPNGLWVTDNAVGPGFFAASGMHMAAGRDFTSADSEGAPRVAIINESLARHFYPGQNPLGRQIYWAGDGRPLEIAGVVKNVKYFKLRDDSQEVLYTPFLQYPANWKQATLLARTDGDPERLLPEIRNALRAVDPNLPLYDITTMDRLVGRMLTGPRLLAILSSCFGLLALGLSAVGLYGVVSYAVARRTGEIGIRMALGARRGSVFALVLGNTGRMAGIGLAAGIAIALATGRMIESMLFGVKPHDALSLAVPAAVLGAAALIAGALPAFKALRVDPMAALRHE